MAEADGDRVPQRPDHGVVDAALQHAAQDDGGIAGDSAARIVPAVGEHDRAFRRGDGTVDALVGAQMTRSALAAKLEQFLAKCPRKTISGLAPVVGDDQHLGAHVRHIGGGEAVDDGDGKDAIPPFERRHPVDESTDRLAAGHEAVDHPAVPDRHGRPDLAPSGRQQQGHQLLGPLDEVGVRKFLVADEDVGRGQHRPGHVAVRIEGGTDRRLGAGERADAGEQVAFAVVIAMRDHRAVQAEGDRIHRQRLGELAQDLVAEALVGSSAGGSRRRRAGDRALDQGVAILARPSSPDDQDRG